MTKISSFVLCQTAPFTTEFHSLSATTEGDLLQLCYLIICHVYKLRFQGQQVKCQGHRVTNGEKNLLTNLGSTIRPV